MSIDLTEIGEYPQSQKANDVVDENSNLHLDRFFMVKIELPVGIPEPILRPKAKLTDLLSCGYFGLRLVVSKRLKDIFQKYNEYDSQYFPMNVILGAKRLDYWLISPFQLQMNKINFAKSEIWICGMGNAKIERIPISSYKEYANIKKEIKLPQRLLIEKLWLNTSNIHDFFILENVTGGIGYYVSEVVKNEITALGCTGIRFEEIQVDAE